MTPLHVSTSYTHGFRFCKKENASGTHQSAWAGTQKFQTAWATRELPPFEPLLMGDTPFKNLPHSLFRPNGGRKIINFLKHFYGLAPHTNYKH